MKTPPVLRKPHRLTSRLRSGFTLVELLLVIVILGILAAIVLPKIAGRGQQAKEAAAVSDISAYSMAVNMFETDNTAFPKSLDELVTAPGDASGWRGPYVEKGIKPDPWGNPYIYEYPGKNNANGFDLSSAGPDGKVGTDDDINNWDVGSKK